MVFGADHQSKIQLSTFFSFSPSSLSLFITVFEANQYMLKYSSSSLAKACKTHGSWSWVRVKFASVHPDEKSTENSV